MYKQDSALNKLQGLVCHKIQPTNQQINWTGNCFIQEKILELNNFECIAIKIAMIYHFY